jgi:hypothetical protein
MKMSQLLGMVLAGLSALAYGVEQAGTAPVATSASLRLAAGEVDRQQLEKRLNSVSTLIEESSAAKQIEASGDARALEKRAKAREFYRSAQDAFNKGELASASQLLSQASMTMFEAVRVAAPEQVTAAKVKADFNTRLETVKALLAAHNRIASEKTSVPGTAETTRNIEKALAEANQLAAEGKYDEGRKVLDRAYLIAKTAIASLRGGDTLVRSLHFATKEEEYRYEIDRNDTHQMLIQVLLSEKRAAADLDAMVKNYLEKARALRAQAEEAAGRKDFEAAIKLLEDSTSEVVRAIRNAGIYIPG